MSALKELDAALVARRDEVEEWLATELARQTVPFYCSVDLRVSDHKVAPVDANLFPGGFNNLAQATHTRAVKAVKATLAAQWPNVRCVALVAERQTRNPYYAVHLNVLREILTAAGVQVQVAFFDGEPAVLRGHHSEVAVDVLRREGDTLTVDGHKPDLVLLNHDQSGGVPAVLQDVAVAVTPPLEAGWSHRRKSAHFFQYERVAGRFARWFGVDAWMLQPYFNVCNRVDMSKRIGMNCLARAVDETLADIKANYARVGSDSQPFVALKADAGTYGMGVVMVDSPDAARNLNRRQRQGLSVVKDGAAVRDILIQEGVPSVTRVEGLIAEPVYYMIGTEVVGGFWRLNQARGERDNLNSRGMLFWPLVEETHRASTYTQRVVARLALLATARELAGDLAQAPHA